MKGTFPRIGVARLVVSIVAACAPGAAHAQRWEVVPAPTATSLRGVSTPTDSVVWVSGAAGSVVRSVDGGGTWQVVSVAGAESLDFRDVEAIDARTAYVLSIGNGSQSRIYKTTDGGATWALQFTNADTSAFYDCFAFWGAADGIAMSDPVNGRFRILTTSDGGASWSAVPEPRSPEAIPGEAAFAASGTCVATNPGGSAWLVTGGAARARMHRTRNFGSTWLVNDIPPIAAGGPASGAFSVAVLDARRLVVTGGNYEMPSANTGNVALSADGGATWRAATGPVPRGYRSGVAVVPGTQGRILVAVGPSGSDFSVDGGDSWMAADTLALNAVSFSSRTAGWAVGPRGRIARWHGGFPADQIRASGKE